jgi:hypothetical protein
LVAMGILVVIYEIRLLCGGRLAAGLGGGGGRAQGEVKLAFPAPPPAPSATSRSHRTTPNCK